MNRRERDRLDGEAEARREAHRAQHAQAILTDARRRIPNRPNDPQPQIGLAADVVDQRIADRVQEHAIDGDVAPPRVFLRRAEAHRGRMPAVEIHIVGAKGGHLDGLAILDDDDHTELHTNRNGLGK